ncbi:GIY-YIG nuclease family protein [Empedobacter falsenii]|uniref:GIY-YIG nuclease family protein n=1 Tax=Empedobacter falsenii TaxID=343874 RepID=A0AAW7DHC6_9FLAO|nr:GIY-YIG nuclease family protein [Empedobacter falsenii]MDM1550918.1 GIY-YIG nuclease family protein [Empedobacter falsenii]
MDKETLLFFEIHKIELNDVVDAEGAPIYQIKDRMKANDKLFAYNTTPCEKGNHTIRDRSGHCIVCNTASIAFMKRSRQTGFVYIAGSIRKNYIKIGMTTTGINDRISRMNSRNVGNTNDWVVLKTIKCNFANMVEFGIQSKLSKYSVDGENSSEIFRCSYNKANEIVEAYFEENQIIKKEQKVHVVSLSKYNEFRNLLNSKR